MNYWAVCKDENTVTLWQEVSFWYCNPSKLVHTVIQLSYSSYYRAACNADAV